jgi:glycerol-3-phosphate dehydrogenase subunit B
MSPTLHYDAVVIGAGVAGLTAAVRLAEGGASVCVLAKGAGSTHLAPGTVDVLGYAPDRVSSPASALGSFVADHPEHPYALVGAESVAPAVQWFAERASSAGYRYVGSLERNTVLPTAVGAPRPSALVPETMAGGDLDSSAPICVVGVYVLRDFHAALCAANVTRAGVEARGVVLDPDVGRAEANALGLASWLERSSFRADLAAQLGPLLRDGERVAFPAILGLRDPHAVWSDLQERLGHAVFEIPTLPPSVPGMRVYNLLRSALRAAGGRLVLGAEVQGATRDGSRVVSVRAHTSGHEHEYAARWFVLATGGVASGALALSAEWVARDTVLDLPLRGAPEDGRGRFEADYFGEQPLARMGVAADSSLIADGTENVLVAGAALPGAVPWREGSGEGISLTTGYAAAQTMLSREGATAAA